MQYRELQAALKNLRHAGYAVQVKLNTSYEILQVEYDRLTSQPVVEPMVEMTAEQFNGWMGLPTDNLAIATQDSPVQPLLAIVNIAPEVTDGIPDQIAVVVPTVEPKLEVKPSSSADKQPTKQLEAIPCKPLRMPTNSYWVDGSELSQHLESTQVQALRNAQDGVRWLKKWARNIQAFAEGFIEGGQVKQPQRSPQVIALDRYRYPQVA